MAKSTETNKPISREMGERIRSLRRERGFSQRELAERLGIHPQVISDVERAETRISIDRLYAILDALGYKATLSVTPQENSTRAEWGPIPTRNPRKRRLIRQGRMMAEKASRHLYDKYDVGSVIAFGSLVEHGGERFRADSDIDLLVEGLSPDKLTRATVSCEMEVLEKHTLEEEGFQFGLDLVRMERFHKDTDSLIQNNRAVRLPKSVVCHGPG